MLFNKEYLHFFYVNLTWDPDLKKKYSYAQQTFIELLKLYPLF